MKTIVMTLILILILASSAFSDVIYFKDGGRAEGIVKEETDEHITIDMGFGTMSVKKDEIDHIEEATVEELEELKKKKVAHEIESGEWAPEGYDKIRALYRSAKDGKNTLQEGRRKASSISAEIAQKEGRISELLGMLDKKGAQLKTIDAKKSVKKYNEVVAEMNSINNHFNKENNAIKTLYENEKKLNTEIGTLASAYRGDYHLFKDTLAKKRSGAAKIDISQDELYFFEIMENKAKEMAADFKRDSALYTTDGTHIVVDTLINGKVSVQLMLDTGASIVFISDDAALRLGIRSDDIKTEMDVMLADGHSVKAKPLILESVKVSDAEVKNVQAAILSNKNMEEADGLLGMSFLSHFVISVDNAGKKLILERVL